jgi:hypothetical protein
VTKEKLEVGKVIVTIVLLVREREREMKGCE